MEQLHLQRLVHRRRDQSGNAGDSYTPSASITLYAQWSQSTPSTYTVTFNGNGGSSPASQTVTWGDSITLPPITWSSQIPPVKPEACFVNRSKRFVLEPPKGGRFCYLSSSFCPRNTSLWPFRPGLPSIHNTLLPRNSVR
ncbi:MAG: InlB B-repeat-containing protein [Treponema sp.]|nr:InlB B-repeat-containing protein [Treponema sp.]